jgi:nucleoid DNA-binding protein
MAKVKKAITKSALYTKLAESSGLKKADVTNLLDLLAETAKAELGPKGAGVFTLPGIARFKVRKVKAVKGGVEKVNPLNGQKYTTKDKPAYNKVTSRPIKAFAEALK